MRDSLAANHALPRLKQRAASVPLSTGMALEPIAKERWLEGLSTARTGSLRPAHSHGVRIESVPVLASLHREAATFAPKHEPASSVDGGQALTVLARYGWPWPGAGTSGSPETGQHRRAKRSGPATQSPGDCSVPHSFSAAAHAPFLTMRSRLHSYRGAYTLRPCEGSRAARRLLPSRSYLLTRSRLAVAATALTMLGDSPGWTERG